MLQYWWEKLLQWGSFAKKLLGTTTSSHSVAISIAGQLVVIECHGCFSWFFRMSKRWNASFYSRIPYFQKMSRRSRTKMKRCTNIYSCKNMIILYNFHVVKKVDWGSYEAGCGDRWHWCASPVWYIMCCKINRFLTTCFAPSRNMYNI